MPSGLDETVAPGLSGGGGGVIFDTLANSTVAISAHRQTRMARFRLSTIHGERANGIRHFVASDFIFLRRHQPFTIARYSGIHQWLLL
jgi:hypothetical protein